MKLTFYGGAKAVTGANYLLEVKDSSKKDGVRRIIIDCGLTQGASFCQQCNWDPFGYDPSEVDEVFITHAHIDHSGRLPKLFKDGFKGKVYSTPPTREFAEPLLLDSQHILSMDAESHKLPLLYSPEDVYGLMDLWEGIPYHKTLKLGGSLEEPAVKVTLYSAGHILGSASILIEAEGKKILFSGDLGNDPSPLIGSSEAPDSPDYCLIESAYGDRVHEDLPNREAKLEEAVKESVAKGGVLMIPAFAMERTQILILKLKQMLEKHKLPLVPIFIDSPLAIKLTQVYNLFPQYFKPELIEKYGTLERMFKFPGLHMTMTTEDSKAINLASNPKIIIAGSGMSQGGRILHHEKRYLSDPRSTLLIFGYQVEGSLGRRLLDGVSPVRIHHEDVVVRARIKAIGAYSAHADQTQLLNWIKPIKRKLKKVWVVQGEESASKALAEKLINELGVHAEVPVTGLVVEL